MRDFTQEIKDLQAGKLKEIQVEKEELMKFREAWLVAEDNKKIVGKAGFGGFTTYVYVPDID